MAMGFEKMQRGSLSATVRPLPMRSCSNILMDKLFLHSCSYLNSLQVDIYNIVKLFWPLVVVIIQNNVLQVFLS